MKRTASSIAVAVLLAGGCHRALGPERAESLAGLVLPLTEGLALVTSGEVEGRAARVVFDTALPYTSVSRGCWREDPPPASPGSVRVPLVGGGWRELPEIELRAARVGPARLGTRTVALSAERDCTLTLGLDVLANYTLTLDPARRELGIALSGSALPSGGERLALTREPTRDWWLVTVRLTKDTAAATGPFVLSTGIPVTRVAAEIADNSGFYTAGDGLPDSAPDALRNAPLRVDAIGFSPTTFASRVPLERVDAWKDDVALGVLGADVLGRFVTTLDVGAGLLVLTRPELEHQVQLSERGGARWLSAASWAAHDAGVQLLLKPDDADTPCVLGLTFPPHRAGTSVQIEVPWAGLRTSQPECAALFEKSGSLAVGGVREGAHGVCGEACVFSEVAERASVSCACEAAPFISEAEEARLLEAQRSQIGADGGVPLIRGWADELPEPEDPK